MTNLPEISYPMTNFEIIVLSVILAFIATIIFNFLYKLIRLFIGLSIESYRVLSGFKKQLDAGEITVEEYNNKVRDFNEKVRRGKIDRK